MRNDGSNERWGWRKRRTTEGPQSQPWTTSPNASRPDRQCKVRSGTDAMYQTREVKRYVPKNERELVVMKRAEFGAVLNRWNLEASGDQLQLAAR